MTKNRSFTTYYFIFFGVTAFIFILLAVSKQFAQQGSLDPNNEHQMTERQRFQSNRQISYKFSSNENEIIHLYAKKFNFEAHVEFPSSVVTNPDRYAESIAHENNGAFDITSIDLGDATKYLFQVSSIPDRQCRSDTTRACQQEAAAPARGNVAEIQLTLPGSKLMPGTYTFAKGGSTPREEIVIYNRQLYSDPSHGKLGCQAWGRGALNVKKADYNSNGELEYLEASFFRVCERTAPFPPALPQDNLLQVEAENIKRYTYHASWRCQLKVAGE
ncbi:MAG: hypothetical protein QNJ54_19485 [Prochloraceae cyanobacterium]|nr:hypothetical protein [Prochloraceae cyanobacterium]